MPQRLLASALRKAAYACLFLFPLSSFAQLSVDTLFVQHVNCANGMDGSIGVAATGGTTPYSFIWSSGATSSTASNLAAGTYTVTVTDNGGLTATVSATVNSPSTTATLLTSKTDMSCFGNGNGAIDLTILDATTPRDSVDFGAQTSTLVNSSTYGYRFQAQSDFTILALRVPPEAGSLEQYFQVVKMACSTCTFYNDILYHGANITGNNYAMVNIDVDSGDVIAIFGHRASFYTSNYLNFTGVGAASPYTTNVNGDATQFESIRMQGVINEGPMDNGYVSTFGAPTNVPGIEMIYTDSFPNYSYSWSNGATTQDLEFLFDNTYTVSVTLGGQCIGSASETIIEPSLLTATKSITDATTFNGQDGAIDLTTMGGTAPYEYEWGSEQETEDLSNIPAGLYYVTITDDRDCETELKAVVNQPDPIISANVQITPTTCAGGSNGAADMTVSGSFSPFTYVWSTGATTEDLSGLSSGNYTVTITDNSGNTLVRTIGLTDGKNPPYIGYESLAGDSCTSTLAIEVTGSQGPYNYSLGNIASGTLTPASEVTDWVQTFGGTNTDWLEAIEYDKDGNIIITGSFYNTIMLDTISLTSQGAWDIFLAKFDPDGNVIWALSEGGSSSDRGLKLALDTAGNIYLGTGIASTVTIAGQLIIGTGFSNPDPVIIKYTPDGTALWAIHGTGSGNPEAPEGMAVTSDGGVVVVGDMSQTITFDGVTTSAPNSFWSGGYHLKLSPSGNVEWLTSYESSGFGGPYDVDVDAEDNVYVCGLFRGMLQIGGVFYPSGGSNDMFVSKLDGSTGDPIWGKWMGGPNSNVAYGIEADDLGNTLIVGTIWDSLNVDGSVFYSPFRKPIMLRLDPDGNLTYGTLLQTGGQYVSAMTVDYEDNVYVSSNGYCTKFSSNGAYIWNKSLGSGNGRTLATNEQGDLAIGGYYYTSFSFDGNTYPSNGSADMLFLEIDAGSAVDTVTNLPGGTYNLTMTDASGCSSTESVTLNSLNNLTSSLTSTGSYNGFDISCFSAADGGINAAIGGGNGTVGIQWNGPQGFSSTSQNLSALEAGTYALMLSDTLGCVLADSIELMEPDSLTIGMQAVDISCNGLTDGLVTTGPSGGATPYTYLWSNAATTSSITNLSAGNYSGTVTDANGCEASDQAVIIEPAVLSIVANLDSNAGCFGEASGGATAVATGGTSPYSYAWSNGVNTASNQMIVAGTYTVTVTDASGCTDQAQVSLSQPPSLAVAMSVISNVNCFGESTGSAIAAGSGGAQPYTYSWSNGSSGAFATALPAGTQTVTITDGNGCTATDNDLITQPAAAVSGVLTVDSNAACFGEGSGGMSVVASGGVAGYSYLWSNNTISAANSGLTANPYTVTITDANSCSTVLSGTITEPTEVSITSTVVNSISCFGGSNGAISTSVIGGTTPYSFSWSTGSSFAAIAALDASTYTVTVTDANGCTKTSVTPLSQPTQLIASVQVDSNVACFGENTGGLTVAGTGGTSPYSYNWSNSGTNASIAAISSGSYSVTVTDNNGCSTQSSGSVTQPASALALVITADSNASCFGEATGGASSTTIGGTAPYSYDWSNNVTQANNPGIAEGTYTLTVTDNNGCTSSSSVTITEPTQLVASIASNSPISCFGADDGALTVGATGGTALNNYAFAWSNGPTQASISALAPGTYTVTVTDDNGCMDVVSGTMIEPAALQVSTSVDSNVSCFGLGNGGATASGSGGTGAYTYSWSNSGTTASISSLAPGTYTVTMTDANNCPSVTETVSIIEPTALDASIASSTDVSCNNGSDGSATATETGGTSPYAYSWSSSGNSALESNLSAGVYTVTVTDANGCEDTAEVNIQEPTALIASIASLTDITCFGDDDGSASVSASGGVSPYSYAWTSGASASMDDNMIPGAFTVIITDANGCTVEVDSSIAEPTQLMLMVDSSSEPLCNGDATGSAVVMASGGTEPYAYSWPSGTTGNAETGLAAGTVSAQVTDGNGCVTSTDVTLGEPDVLALTIASTDVNCEGGMDGEATATIAGGITPYTIQWNDPENQTTLVADSLEEGTYIAVITDSNGCSTEDSVTIGASFANPVVDLGADTIAGCKDTTIALDAGNGVSFDWSTGETSQTILVDTSGIVSVDVTDVNGCVGSDTVQVVLVGECVGLTEAFAGVSVRYYPNPTDGILNLEMIGFKGKEVTINVMNARGQEVYSEQFQKLQGDFRRELDLRDKAQGVYFIQLTTNGESRTDRVSVL